MKRDSLNVIKQYPVTLSVAALCLLAFCFSGMVDSLGLDQIGPNRWASPNLLVCHLLHWNGDHLLWDLLMFVSLGALCEAWMRTRYYATLLVAAAAIPISLGICQPELATYRGLSGLDTAIFSLLMAQQALDKFKSQDKRAWLFAGLWTLMCGKIFYEFVSGNVLFVQDTSFIPVPWAHLMGALVGLLLALPSYPSVRNAFGLAATHRLLTTD